MSIQQLPKISPFRLSSLLRNEKNPNLALQLFQNPNPDPSSSSKPFRYSLLSYDIIITKLARAKMFTQLQTILTQLNQETRFTPKEIIFCNIITFYGRSKLPDQALIMYDKIPSFRCTRTVKSLNTLLNALLKCKQFGKIRDVYLNVDKYGSYVFDVCSYNILINACCICNSFDDAWKLFDEMIKNRISPNNVTFATLINGLCLNGKLDDAFKLKEDMLRKYGLKGNVCVYTSLIKGLCKVKEVDLAFKVKEEMVVETKLGVDSAVYNTLISGLLGSGRKGEVNGVLEEMRGNGIEPDTVTYNVIITGFCNEKDFGSAFGVLKEMVEKGCKPDIISYNAIVSGLCKEGKVKEAIDLFEDMPRSGCVPDVVTYRILFDGLCDEADFDEAEFILDEMLFKGHVPRVGSVNKFVDGLCREGRLKLLGSVLNSLAKRNVMDLDLWRTVIHNICMRVEKSISCELVDTLIVL